VINNLEPIVKMMHHLLFFISEAFIGMKRSALMTVLTILTISISLIILGIFVMINVNVRHVTSFLSTKLEIRIFLKDNLSRADIVSFQNQLTQMEGVTAVSFVNKNVAWQQFSKSYEKLNLSKRIENPLPHSFKLSIDPNYSIYDMTHFLSQQTQYVSDVKNGGVLAERVNTFIKWMRLSGVTFILFLTIATLFIIINTIRLTIVNRQEEISIMSLVGATHLFIKGPFLIEGVVMGVLGSLGAIVFLNNVYYFWGLKLNEALPFIPFMTDAAVLSQVYWSIGLIGTFLGVMGAYISVTKSLKLTI